MEKSSVQPGHAAHLRHLFLVLEPRFPTLDFGGFFAQIPGEFDSPTGRPRVFLGQISSELGALGLRGWCLSPTLTPVPPLWMQAVHEQKRRIQQTPGFHRLTLGSLGGGQPPAENDFASSRAPGRLRETGFQRNLGLFPTNPAALALPHSQSRVRVAISRSLQICFFTLSLAVLSSPGFRCVVVCFFFCLTSRRVPCYNKTPYLFFLLFL